MSSDIEATPNDQELDSEDEMDWEEVDVPAHLDVEVEEQPHLEITLKPLEKKIKGKGKEEKSQKKGITHEERLVRINCHKMHTVVLLANAKVRNSWINDETLQARLMSLTPITLQNEFAQIHPSHYPDKGHRGRLFEKALQHLAQWWSQTFFEVLPTGHIRNHTFDEVQSKLESFDILYDDKELDDDTLESVLSTEIERIRGPKSLMKHALNRSGSRDVSAQLFTSLCRAIGLPARLVVSLQSVPWQPSIGKPKPTYTRKSTKGKAPSRIPAKDEGDSVRIATKGKSKASVSFEAAGQRLDDAPVQMSEKARGKQRAEPVIKLRKQKDKGHRLGDAAPSRRLASPDPTTTPPVFWTEVFSRPDSRWMPVDPVRGYVNKRKAFDPTPTATTASPGTKAVNPGSLLPPREQPKPSNYYSALPKGVKQENRMLYVMAFEEDGYARDVTRRYARDYNAKIAKHQGGSNASNTGGKARQVWWEHVCGLVKRPYQLHRDDLEDDELTSNQMSEGMPTTISGFKDHPLYVLTRHLKQTEVIHPPPPSTPEIGKFRGEPVYPRSSVVPLKSAETWMRQEGRRVIIGNPPLKIIKARPGTINKQREVELMKEGIRDAGRGVEDLEMTQGLYARSQTELYIPPPLVDGKIPKNDFGNIDLYVPTMLPRGAVHVPYKGTAKIAKKLGLDHAEAVTGFEFRKRRAHPVLTGIVIAAENESALLEAYWEHQKIEDEKARRKKEEKALQLWTKLVHGLRIRQRLQAEYADRIPAKKKQTRKVVSASSRTGNAARSQRSSLGVTDGAGESQRMESDESQMDEHDDDIIEEAGEHENDPGPGGFLVDADDVVQAFNLPKYNPLILESSNNLFVLGGGKRLQLQAEADRARVTNDDVQEQIDYATYDLEDHEVEEPPLSDGTMDVDVDVESGDVDGGDAVGATKGITSMQEMMDAHSRQHGEEGGVNDSVDQAQISAEGANDAKSRLRLPARSRSPVATSSTRRSSRAVSLRKRRVTRVDDGGSEADGEHQKDVTSDWEALDEGDDPDMDAGSVDDEEDDDDDTFGSRKRKAKVSPSKQSIRKRARGGSTAKGKTTARTRGQAQTRSPTKDTKAVAAAPTDRVLRSRRSAVNP